MVVEGGHGWMVVRVSRLDILVVVRDVAYAVADSIHVLAKVSND